MRFRQKKSEGLKINGFSKKITEKAHILAKTSIEREWLGTSSTKHRAVQLDTVEVLFDYFCDLYWLALLRTALLLLFLLTASQGR